MDEDTMIAHFQAPIFADVAAGLGDILEELPMASKWVCGTV